MLDLAGIGTLTGGAGDDTLYGQKGGDTLTGGAGEDTLYGGRQGDTLEGGIGADFLDGGDGIDTASYASSDDTDGDGEGVTVNLDTGESRGDDAEGDTFVGIENLVGSDHDDTLTGNRGVNIIDGGQGVDMLYGGGGGDTLTGGAGDDMLYGGRQGDTLRGEAGADTLEGGKGTDILEGGAGADTYVFRSGDGADTIRGEDAETILVDGNNVVVVNRLTFKDATGFGDFSFSRNDANDVVIAVGDDSVVILAAAYADGRYSIHYGDSDTAWAGWLSAQRARIRC